MAKCSSCDAEVRPEGPDSACHRCGAPLWRPATTTELGLVAELTQRIGEHLPAAGRRSPDQIDGVIDAHLPDDRQAAARDVLHRTLKVLPLRAGERAVWASRVDVGNFGERISPSGSSSQVRSNHILVTSQRIMLITPGVGRGKKPTVSVLTVGDLSVAAHAPTTTPDTDAYRPDIRLASVMLTLTGGGPAYRWREMITLGANDSPWFPRWFQGLIAAVEVAQRVAAGELQMSGAQPVIIDGIASEASMAGWLAGQGIEVMATGASRDGGVDLRGPKHVGQVKMTAAKVGPVYVQAIVGIGYVEGRQPLFFSKAGYTPAALDWAEQAKLPLFTFSDGGQVRAANRYGELAAHVTAETDPVARRRP
jgi:hypothetical protein